jgi:hypothetical protein
MYDQKVRPQSSVAIRYQKATNNNLGAQVQLEKAVAPNPMPKTIVSVMGRLRRKYSNAPSQEFRHAWP